ncbi:tripartite motif-containing protein 3-like [Patiria miniata]|uniref:Uncharacterized protein n=1 Tax=Patiria miniata TaxID=46514 RepID=A0A914A4S8_PATMI|nr:tripartite motif-containing protein 3-like [Patiria miniata]
MAQDLSAQSLLEKISVDHLECSICTNRFNQPKVLDCLHSFCLECLQKLSQGKEAVDSKLKCPLCRRETTTQHVGDLPDNFTLSALVEEVTMQEKLLEGQGSEIKCQSCNEGNPAASRCMDCDHFLCQECQSAHGRLAMLTSHQVYDLAQLRSGEIAYKSKLREAPKCGKHRDQNLSFYCNSCEQLVCTTCCILDHTKPEHSLTSLPEALERCKQEVAEVTVIAEQHKADFGIVMEEIDVSNKKLEANFDDVRKKISVKADDEVAKIRQEEHTLKQELEKIYQNRVKTFGTAQATNNTEMSETERKLDEVNRLMAQASCFEIVDLKQKLLRNLKEQTERFPRKVPNSLSFVEFDEEGQSAVGELVFETGPKSGSAAGLKAASTEQTPPARPLRKKDIGGKWGLKIRITQFSQKQTKFRRVFGVAVFSNGEILATDMGHKMLISYAPSSGKLQAHARPLRLQIKGLDNPSCVAVNNDDHLVLLDKLAVKIFDRKHQPLHQFKPGEGPNSTPTCLAVDDNNLIAVGYEKAEEISLHEPDGTLIRTLPAAMIGSHLTISKQQRLIYTCWEKKKLVSTDYVGGKVFSSAIPCDMHGIWGPTGVCCDNSGHIFVAIHGWLSGGIYKFSSEGGILGCVISECKFPASITSLPGTGDLVVASNTSVQIFHEIQTNTEHSD